MLVEAAALCRDAKELPQAGWRSVVQTVRWFPARLLTGNDNKGFLIAIDLVLLAQSDKPRQVLKL